MESLKIILTKISGPPKQIREKTKRYFRENWGFPFIAGFILLLLVAAIFLVFSNYLASIATSVTDQNMANSMYITSWAEGTATCAYFALVVGVVLLLGNVNSTLVHERVVKIKGLKVISKCIRYRKNRFNKGAVFRGSD